MNKYRLKVMDGKECVLFTPNNCLDVEVTVDKTLWFNLLNKYDWNLNYQSLNKMPVVYTYTNKKQLTLTSCIAEYEYDEIDRHNRVVDHINRNRLDNRCLKYGSMESAYKAAEEYIDTVVKEKKEIYVLEQYKKDRDLSFEQSLRDKINYGEIEEVLSILKKYNIA